MARAKPGRTADALAELPNAATLVPEMPVQDLHMAIKDQGPGESLALLELATPEQVRAVLDLEVWRRDSLDMGRLSEWLTVLNAMRPSKAAYAFRALDPEVLEVFILENVRVFDLTLEELPMDLDRAVWTSPDRFYACVFHAALKPEQAQRMQKLLEDLYRYQLSWAQALLRGARVGLRSILEERAYQMRSGRISDLGFPDYGEALEVYQPLEPSAVAIGEGTAARPVAETGGDVAAGSLLVASGREASGFWATTLAAITDPVERERLGLAFVTLANRVLVADRMQTSDAQAMREALQRARDTLSIGLEQVSRGDVRVAAESLQSISAQRIFQVGHGLTVKLQKLARALIASAPRIRFDSPWQEVVEALSQQRPRMSRMLDEPPRAGERAFASTADIQRVTEALHEAGVAVALLAKLDVSIDTIRAFLADDCMPHPDDLTIGDVVRTVAAHVSLGHEPVATPLTREDIEGLVDSGLAAGKVAAIFGSHLPDPVSAELRTRLLEGLSADLERLERPIEMKGVTGLMRRLKPPAKS